MRALRVLAVDDNRATAFGLARLLEAKGHSVTTALNGLAALDLAERIKPDVILLDVMMPAMDGYTVTRKLRASGETAPIVIISAMGNPEDKERSAQAGANHHLVKPVDLDTLWAILDDVAARPVH